jgi:O-antigen biosynthesis protein WbqV
LGCPRIAILDHFDHALLAACEQVRELSPRTEVVEILADIRDQERLGAWFQRFRPDIVVNSAALKHVHLGERHPVECVRTNLFGMRNVLHAAAACGAKTFLQISTDKAAAPVCVMGASKRLAELHLWGFARESAAAPAMKAVRFGNVLGSQGSVVPRFQRRIDDGRDLEVTHADMRRFFMTAREASQFVAQVCALSGPEVPGVASYCLELGSPVRILDIANDMLKSAGSPLGVVFTGLREGEKLGEVLLDECETASASALEHCYRIAPKSRNAAISSAELMRLETFIDTHEGKQVTRRLFALLDEFLERREASAG